MNSTKFLQTLKARPAASLFNAIVIVASWAISWIIYDLV
jgi:hypothetical protein